MCCGRGKSSKSSDNDYDGIELPARPVRPSPAPSPSCPPSPPPRRSYHELEAADPVTDQTGGILSTTYRSGRPISRYIDPAELSRGVVNAEPIRRRPRPVSMLYTLDASEHITPSQAIFEVLNERVSEPLYKDEPETPISISDAAAQAVLCSNEAVRSTDSPSAASTSITQLERHPDVGRPIYRAGPGRQAALYSNEAVGSTQLPSAAPASTYKLERRPNVGRPIYRAGPGRQATLHSNSPVRATNRASPVSATTDQLEGHSNAARPSYRIGPGREARFHRVPPAAPVQAAAPRSALNSNVPVRAANEASRAPVAALYSKKPIRAAHPASCVADSTPGKRGLIYRKGRGREPPPVPPAVPRAPLQTNEPVRTVESAAPVPVSIDPLEGHSNVGRPMVREGRSNVAEITHLGNIVRANGHVRSPSGHILSSQEFLARPDRPRLMEERQEAIRRKCSQVNLKEREKEAEEVMSKVRPLKEKKMGKKGCWSWGCFGKAGEQE